MKGTQIPFPENPFAVLTFIAAPAVLTNASAVMSLTTSNRLARAVDRARALVKELADEQHKGDSLQTFRVREVEVARERAGLLIRALGFFQLAYGGFAAATLVSLLGAAIVVWQGVFIHIILGAALICALVAVGGIVAGAAILVRESRIAYRILREETVFVLESLNDAAAKKPG
jgi:hypothetical protein